MSAGFHHLIFQRSSALVALCLIWLAWFMNLVFGLSLILVLGVYHFSFGIETLFVDYMHNLQSKYIGLTFFRIAVIYFLKFAFFVVVL